MDAKSWNSLAEGDVIRSRKGQFTVVSSLFRGYSKLNTVFLRNADGVEFGSADPQWFEIVAKVAPVKQVPVPEADKPYDHAQGVPVPAPLVRELVKHLSGCELGDRLKALLDDYEVERKALAEARFGPVSASFMHLVHRGVCL